MGKFNPLNHPICLMYPFRSAPSSWTEHVPFAMALIDMLRPRVFAELGTYYGVSYCAFCQAVEVLGTDTRCYAIDTWQGDSQGGTFGSEVLDDLKKYHDPLYGSFSRLVQSDFNSALSHFDDESIDLLHVDGFHTYEAVKQDFQNWLSKMSNRGVVIFHDINVREHDFGVRRFWEEIKPDYPNFEFVHGHGLGLLAVGPQYPESLRPLLESSEEDSTRIREFFHQLGSRLVIAQEVQELRQLTTAQSDVIEKLNQSRALRFFYVWSDQGAWTVARRGLAKSREKLKLDSRLCGKSTRQE